MSTDDLIDLSRQAANEAAKAYEQGRADERTALAKLQTEGELTDEALVAIMPVNLRGDEEDALAFARAVEAAVIARRPAPAPPAEGDVAELMKCLKTRASFLSEVGANLSQRGDAFYFTRAAELLQRQHPQPVPVSERLPGSENCDAEGRCWWFCFECPGEHSYWILAKEVYCDPTLWLPAHALPLPSGEVQP